MNPTGLTAGQEAQNQYTALVKDFAAFNALALANAPAGGTAIVMVPSLPAIQLVFALAAAGMQPTAAEFAAIWGPQTVPAPEGATTAPAQYVLGPQLGPNTWVLDTLGEFPAIGTVIPIGTLQYTVGAAGPFKYTATLVEGVAQ